MPIYEYANEEFGIKTDLRFPVDNRPDEIVLRRCRVPSRVTVGVGAQPPSMGQQLAQGYKKLEETGGLEDKGGKYLPIETIKRALEEPDAPEPAAIEQ